MEKIEQGVGELYLHLVKQLKTEPNFVTDNGKLKKWVVSEAARSYSPDVIALLLNDKLLKESFFVNVNGTEIFKLDKFLLFVEQKNFLDDGYTQFSQKVGLKINGKFINQHNEVELVFPHKDCVLEGGQTKDDQKRQEIFFNEVLAQDEITQLLEPKVLTAGKRYDVDGEHPLDGFTRDAEINKKRGLPQDTITDNLIIKGNNLLALHTLKKEFANKVKLIYIDPPYYFDKTKPADTFSYNSNFKLSTWLVFMKDRLKVANDLLKSNGVILVHINESGIHWLKLLMEEIFKKENFVETFIWRNTDNPDALSKKSRSAVEYVVCFEKNIDRSKQYNGKKTDNGDAPLLNTGNNVHELTFPKGVIHFNIPDGEYEPSCPERVKLVTPIKVNKSLNENDVVLRGPFKWGQEMLDTEIAKGTYFLVKTNRFSIRFQRRDGSIMAPEKFIDNQYLSKSIGVGTNEDATTHLEHLGIKFTASKPESVGAFFLNAVTEEGDIVLDFFLGSGTTASVAHKMGRQYIGIDQMDYIETAALVRLKKVIEGEPWGISQKFNWHGGGGFVYFELKKYNQLYIDEIESAKNTDELLNIWGTMKQKAFFRFNIDMQKFDDGIDEFKTLTLEQQKECLCQMLDLNQLYINRSDIDDETAQVTEHEKKITRDYYREA